jgi:homoserine kinase
MPAQPVPTLATARGLRAAAVRVPGSTSNLGPGFDVLGLAVDRALRAAYEPGQGPLEVVRSPSLEAASRISEDFFVRAFRAALPAGVEAGGRLVVESDVPVARGLGSSAAARVAGELLAWAASGRAMDRDRLLARAAALEGHPDNAAPAVLGGLVASVRDGDRVRIARLPLSPEVGFAFADPGFEVRTAEARRVMPTTVPLALATATSGRLALLLHGLAVADPECIAAGLHDELHVPHRLPLVPGARVAMAAALEAGAWGVTLSGSGSGLVALGPRALAPELARALAEGFRRGGAPGGEAFALRPDPVGATQLDPSHQP